MHLGALIRAYHDAAATFPWAGREWMFEPRQPVETVCHNELFPWNTVFRSDVPVAFIDWDTAAPGSRAWDLGLAVWRWVPALGQRCPGSWPRCVIPGTLRWGSLHVGYLWPGSENTGLL